MRASSGAGSAPTGSPTASRGSWGTSSASAATALALVVLALVGCQPTVRLEAPEKPIVINLNVKIEQEVRVRVERDVDQLLQDKELF